MNSSHIPCKILFLTNFYPPASRGGYEEWCHEVATGLRARGHDVTVVTSQHGARENRDTDPEWVHRDLYLEMELASLRNGVEFFTRRQKREEANLVRLRQIIQQVQPDVVLIWGMWNLPRSVPALVETLLPGRVAYYMGDYWPTLPTQHDFYWQAPARNLATAVPKRILGTVARALLAQEQRPALQFERVIFPSAFMRDEFVRRGVAVQEAEVIYGAIDTQPYLSCAPRASQLDSESGHEQQGMSLLYVGRLTADKGVHTALEAMTQLVHVQKITPLQLTIVGAGDADYEQQLHQLVQQHQLEPFVQFIGPQPKNMLPQFYQQADIFLFTSIWQEPFGRVVVEAMASGIAVVGAKTGGAAEIMLEDENALTFAPGDASSLAAQIMRLVESPSMRLRLGRAGQQIAVQKFQVRRMVTEIEAYLLEMVNG